MDDVDRRGVLLLSATPEEEGPALDSTTATAATVDGSHLPHVSYGLQSRGRGRQDDTAQGQQSARAEAQVGSAAATSRARSLQGRRANGAAPGGGALVFASRRAVNGAPASQSRLGERLDPTVRGPGKFCLLSISPSLARPGSAAARPTGRFPPAPRPSIGRSAFAAAAST